GGAQPATVVHDLVVVIQQRGVGTRPGGLHRPGQSTEHEAVLTTGPLHGGHVLLGHRHLGDLDDREPGLGEPAQHLGHTELDHLLTHGHQLDTDPGHRRLLHLRAHVPASLPMLDGGASVVAFSCRPLWSLRAERVDPAALRVTAAGAPVSVGLVTDAPEPRTPTPTDVLADEYVATLTRLSPMMATEMGLPGAEEKIGRASCRERVES